jgi:hypothetical protein
MKETISNFIIIQLMWLICVCMLSDQLNVLTEKNMFLSSKYELFMK